MKRIANKARLLAKYAAAILSIGVAHSVQSLELSQTPLFLAQPVKPIVMLNMSNDHQLYFKAYDDYTDLDPEANDGPDTTYKNSYNYYGYFDSDTCYAYQNQDSTDRNGNTVVSGVYVPTAEATNHYCDGVNAEWSGNFLNWASMTRMDAVRKILYGGKRDVDSATETVLERAYLPSDAHAFTKYYNGTDLARLTPFNNVTTGVANSEDSGITFCNVTYSANGQSQDVDKAPLLRAKPGNYSLWASNEGYQCLWASEKGNGQTYLFEQAKDSGVYAYAGFPSYYKEYAVRVKVCDSSSPVGEEDYCVPYPDGNSKPGGLLHEYGQSDQIRFGLLTGSYDKNKSGGVLRKNISDFSEEIDVAGYGQFVELEDKQGIVEVLDKLRIARYNHGSGQYNSSDNCPWELASFSDGDCSNWGNPQSEIYLESLNYLAGLSATDAFSADDSSYISGLTSAAWTAPLNSTNYCAATSVIQFNASTSSYDGDQLSGSSLPRLDVDEKTDEIGVAEGIHSNTYFVGENGGGGIDDNNQLCTPKTVSSLAGVEGTCPDAPRLEGSYKIAGLAYYARSTDLMDLPGTQSVQTYGVALAPAVPKVTVPVPGQSGKNVTILPACRNKAPHPDANCAIVDFKIVDQKTRDGKNTGSLYVNWEDSEQGGDYDQDMWGIIKYEVSSTELSVKTQVMAQSTPNEMGFGYVISGTTNDGFHVHSGVNDFIYGDLCKSTTSSTWVEGHWVNGHWNNGAWVDGHWVNGYNNVTSVGDCTCRSTGDGTQGVEHSACDIASETSQTYTIGDSSSELLEQPLYYAAKWGGYNDDENGNSPTVAEIAGNEPENYFYAIEPSKLEENLGAALDRVAAAAGSASSVAANSTRLGTDTVMYQALFDSSDWHGELKALKLVTKEIENDDGSKSKVTEIGNAKWVVDNSKITSGSLRKVYTYSNGDGAEFKWDSLSDTQQQLLKGVGETDDNVGKSVLNWVRGADVTGLRDREFLLGDIVNSSPVFAGRKNYNFHMLSEDLGGHKYQEYLETKSTRKEVVYVGANDGMLHAFDAENGTELFAYVPSGVYSKLKDLSSPNYGTSNKPHEYNVDGPLFVGDAYVDGEWKNLLVGTLGAGGRGVFVLDVTDPNNFNESDVLFEITGDSFSGELGNVVDTPVIAPTEDGWKLFFGNGYNSTGEKAHLFVVDLEAPLTRTEIVTASNSGANGLAGAALLADGTGAITSAYAGDLLGNMWKFEVAKKGNSTAWQLALSGGPLFTARYPSADPDADDAIQPITSTPTLGLNRKKDNAVMVYFGTGSYLTSNDNSSTGVNSVYAIADQGSAVSGRDALMEKSISESGDVRDVVNNDNTDWWSDKSGWFMDFDTAPGERVTSKPLLEHDRLLFPTMIPSSDPCAFGGSGWMMELIAVGDQDNSHSIFGEDGKKSEYAIIGYSGIIRDRDSIILPTNDIKGNPDLYDGDAPPDAIGRMSWRQLR
ncbi:PilC/PilY family type IV pilus protein [Microbulbifer sp.]|uniref:pilus assembly protein n=1 Tax=Microbulbifer sp. TaxID=1908541 RepID=UPI00258FC7EA|nr:PilC/PilY family type IV pilus protein [Microbulbifer sp.]